MDEDALAAGKALRATLARSDQRTLQLPPRDPVAIMTAQNANRISSLVPIRHARMLQSPFAYYRGTAATMAHDLAAAPVSGPHLLLSGDAHISNFGLYASPERRLLFDLNDFDEAGYGPWEWDVKRLVTSVIVSALENGYRADQAYDAALITAISYRTRLRQLIKLSPLERYLVSVDTEWLEDVAPRPLTKLIKETARKARKRTSARMVEKITAATDDGGLHIVEAPPLLVRVGSADMLDHVASDTVTDPTAKIAELYEAYRHSLRPDARTLMAQYEVVDAALRVVGVGSVGTRSFIVLLAAGSDHLFLQVKEATAAVLQSHGGLTAAAPTTAPPAGAGRESYRVVSGQQTLQAQSDPLLGWVPTINGRDFYWRQFRDMKGSVATEELNLEQFEAYTGTCAALLARAHAQSPQAAVVAGYLGKSDQFDRAVTEWSQHYADQVLADFDQLTAAARSGRIEVGTE